MSRNHSSYTNTIRARCGNVLDGISVRQPEEEVGNGVSYCGVSRGLVSGRASPENFVWG